MNVELNPKLLDVVEFRAEGPEFTASQVLTGTIVEILGETPGTVLIELTDEEGIPTAFVDRRIDQITSVWRSASQTRAEPGVDMAQQLFDEGFLLLQNGHASSARDRFRKAFDLNPKLAGTLMNSALMLAARGKYEAMIAICQLILELQPGYALARENLAITFLNRGVKYARRRALDSAVKDFNASLMAGASEQTAKVVQHNLIAAYTQIGILHIEIRRYEEAVGHFQLALILSPSEAMRKNLAIALVALAASKSELATLPLEPVFFRLPMQMGLTLSECLNAYGATLAILGELPKAQHILEAAVENDPTNDLARNNLAIVSARRFPLELPISTLGLMPVEITPPPAFAQPFN